MYELFSICSTCQNQRHKILIKLCKNPNYKFDQTINGSRVKPLNSAFIIPSALSLALSPGQQPTKNRVRVSRLRHPYYGHAPQ